MSELKSKPPLSFWIISILALIWNIKVVFSYLGIAFMKDQKFNLLPAPEKEYLSTIPVLISATYTISVLAGIIGCMFLLLRRKKAALIFLVAFIADIIYQHYFLVIQKNIEIVSNNSTYPIVSVIVSFLLVVFASSNHKEDYFN